MIKNLIPISLSLVIGLLGISGLRLTSFATPVPSVAQTIGCREDGSMAEMKKCAQDEYIKVDQQLNKAYQKLMANLEDSQRKQRLISAQQAWILFRDETCSYEASEALGGTLEGLLLTNCLTDVTEQRTSELKEYLLSLNER